MRKIIYTRPDGGLSVVTPVLNTIREIPNFTEAEAEIRAWNKLPIDAQNPRFIDEADIPTDRTFRDAWEQVERKIEHNMDKCREIVRDRIRTARVPLLEALDVEYLRALEEGDNQRRIEIIAEKDALRDAPANPAIDAASSVNELKQLLPK